MRQPTAPHQLFPLFALGLLAAGSIWLEQATRSDLNPDTGPLRHDPDLIVEHFSLVRFDHIGKRQYELTGTKMTHFADDDTVELDAPQIVFAANGRPLTIRSNNATVFNKGDRVLLKGNVRAKRVPDAEHQEMTFASASLTVWPDDERAETHDPLILTQGSSEVHANSMMANNLFGTAVLGGDVTATLVRKSKRAP